MREISVVYGDGIGPEIMDSVIKIMKHAGADIKFSTVEMGIKFYEKGIQTGIPDSAWENINRTKVVLKAPITTPQGQGVKSLNVTMRKKLGLYANVRPCISFIDKSKNIDVVIIRENEEDLYAGIEYKDTYDSNLTAKTITYTASERICRYAFEYAKKNNRKKVTCFIKDNIMKLTDGTFHKAFDYVASLYPDIKNDSLIVDIGTARLAKYPERFDVIVTENLYGDIISDVVAEISGSIGISGSANIGSNYAMFEAVHGSAPDIAGKNIANPSALLNAAINMLYYLSQDEIAKKIQNAWLHTIENGMHTVDLYDENHSKKKLSTTEFTDEICKNIDTNIKNYDMSPMKCDLLNKSDLNDRFKSLISETMQSTPKHLVGVDLCLQWNSDMINELLKKIEEFNTLSGFVLCNISIKGLSLWPEKTIEDPMFTDTVVCRFIADKDQLIKHGDILDLMHQFLDKDIEVTRMYKLYIYGDRYGFRV
ncbi:isocitrate dehydrogenase [Anaplasmataceae bacterium AB001_6]|nr:isocitrate dehydrogenase [Anaplasmataceae bacterium AB001_6]